jgi:hypothetical protein
VNPLVKWSSLGAREDDDLLSALEFLRNVKSDTKNKLVGDRFGIYGAELGAFSALRAAKPDIQIRALVLDSVPETSADLLGETVKSCTGMDNRPLKSLATLATRIYMIGAFDQSSSCEIARSLRDQKVLLLTGSDAGYLISSTNSLRNCFPSPENVESRTDLPLSGLNLTSATGEQGEAYDRVVIEFFDKFLR